MHKRACPYVDHVHSSSCYFLFSVATMTHFSKHGKAIVFIEICPIWHHPACFRCNIGLKPYKSTMSLTIYVPSCEFSEALNVKLNVHVMNFKSVQAWNLGFVTISIFVTCKGGGIWVPAVISMNVFTNYALFIVYSSFQLVWPFR